jgi:hypothetical protein
MTRTQASARTFMLLRAHRFQRPLVLAVMMVTLGAASACRKNQDAAESTPAPAALPAPATAAITSIEVGRHIGANRQMLDSTSVFGVNDTMYVVVMSSSTPSGATMTARWTFETGQAVDSLTQTVASTDSSNTTTVTEFHAAKATPWPTGKYTVDVLLDGQNAGSKTVEVRK